MHLNKNKSFHDLQFSISSWMQQSLGAHTYAHLICTLGLDLA